MTGPGVASRDRDKVLGASSAAPLGLRETPGPGVEVPLRAGRCPKEGISLPQRGNFPSFTFIFSSWVFYPRGGGGGPRHQPRRARGVQGRGHRWAELSPLRDG